MRDLATAEAGESFPKSDCVVVASCSRYVGLLEDGGGDEVCDDSLPVHRITLIAALEMVRCRPWM